MNTFPELAFDPQNGVPLCGNCHTEIKGVELKFVEEFVALQQGSRRESHRGLVESSPSGGAASTTVQQYLNIAVSGGSLASFLRNRPDIATLQQRAESDPRNTEYVTAWFCRLRPSGGVSVETLQPGQAEDDAKKLISFYEKHHDRFGESADIYFCLADAMIRLEYATDTILEVFDRCHRCANREWANPEDAEVLELCIQSMAPMKIDFLCKVGRAQDAFDFLSPLVQKFPENEILREHLTDLHRRLSLEFRDDGQPPSKECVQHAMKYAEMRPDFSPAYSWLAFLLTGSRDFPGALKFANRAVETAASDREKAEAFRTIACVHCGANLHENALPFLRKALEVDEHDPETLRVLAHINEILGRTKDAIRFARKCLLYADDEGKEECIALIARLSKSE